MSDIANVLELLCEHLNSSIEVVIKPEYFMLAKSNKTTDESNAILWTTLHILSYHAVTIQKADISFEEYDEVSATKLYFGFLQYPELEFYGLKRTCNKSRVLLIAFSWILVTQNVLTTIIQIKLLSSILGNEYSLPNLSLVEVSKGETSSVNSQIKNILHLNSKVNFNLKYIYLLIQEKVKLVNEVHGLTSNIDNLSHLNVAEIALLKRLTTHMDSTSTEQQTSELYKIGTILNLHAKWMEKQHIFYDWMVPVIKESKRIVDILKEKVNWVEVRDFIALEQYIINKNKLTSITSEKREEYSLDYFKFVIGTNISAARQTNCEALKILINMNTRLSKIKELQEKNEEELELQLQNILKTYPHLIKL